jgi:hypothetical protein
MSIPIATAEQVPRSRFGEPAKEPPQYVISFKTPGGRVLALDRNLSETTIWFQPRASPTLDGIQLIPNTKSTLNGPIVTVTVEGTLRVAVNNQAAADRILSWS